MSLRHHRDNEADDFNPVWIMPSLSEKVSDVEVKEKILTELINNRLEYDLSSESSAGDSVNKAFDKVISDLKLEGEKQLDKVKIEMQNLTNQFELKKIELENQLEATTKSEAMAHIYAQNKTNKKIEKWEKLA